MKKTSCAICGNENPKEKDSCCQKYWRTFEIIPNNSFVRMNKNNVFYNSTDNLDMFHIGVCNNNTFDFNSFDFVNFFKKHIGFENGEKIGYTYKSTNDVSHVFFLNPFEDLDFGYYHMSDLLIADTKKENVKHLLAFKMMTQAAYNKDKK